MANSNMTVLNGKTATAVAVILLYKLGTRGFHRKALEQCPRILPINSDKEKNDSQLLALILSLWAYVLAAKDSFVNNSYNPADEEILLPKYNIRRLLLWDEYFLRYDVTSHCLEKILMKRRQQTHLVSSTVVWASDEQVRVCDACHKRVINDEFIIVNPRTTQ